MKYLTKAVIILFYVVITYAAVSGTLLMVWGYITYQEAQDNGKRLDNIELKVSDLQQRADSLESRIYTIETLYRAHLEECSFISRFDIQVGYDNYLRLRKDDGSIRGK